MVHVIRLGFAECTGCGILEHTDSAFRHKWRTCPICDTGFYCPQCWTAHWKPCLSKYVAQVFSASAADEEQVAAEQPVGAADEEPDPFKCRWCKDENVGASCQECGSSCCFDCLMPVSNGLVCIRCWNGRK